MDPGKLCLLVNSFINAQFSYCPLIWMFHDRCLNAKVNNIHERALKIVYKDTHADYKARNDLNPSFTRELFVSRGTQYNLRNKNITCHSINQDNLIWYTNSAMYGLKAVANATP